MKIQAARRIDRTHGREATEATAIKTEAIVASEAIEGIVATEVIEVHRETGTVEIPVLRTEGLVPFSEKKSAGFARRDWWRTTRIPILSDDSLRTGERYFRAE